MTSEHNKRIAREAFEALMAGHLTDIGELVTPDAVLHQCGFLHPIPARSIVDRTLPGPRPLHDPHVRVERIVAEGDLVALHWRTSGQYQDPDGGYPGGTEISFPSMTFLRFEDGRISEIWNIQDTATIQTQLHAWTERRDEAG
jgi:ketosteroid isomerase-like protein